MVEKQSWLEGPQVPGENEDPLNPSQYPGQDLGLPQEGPGSVASLIQRVAAIAIDWFLCLGMATFITRATDLLGDTATVTMLTFIVLRFITVWLFAQSPGHSVIGIGVGRVDDRNARVGAWRSAVRVLLTIFLFPPLVQDSDMRGLHDRATGTAVIRTR